MPHPWWILASLGIIGVGSTNPGLNLPVNAEHLAQAESSTQEIDQAEPSTQDGDTEGLTETDPPAQEVEGEPLPRLSQEEIEDQIQALPPWQTDGLSLYATCWFTDFVTTIGFVNQLAAPAEALGHHPDLLIRYNRLDISLLTHDSRGVTDLDLQLAEQISALLSGAEAAEQVNCL